MRRAYVISHEVTVYLRVRYQKTFKSMVLFSLYFSKYFLEDYRFAIANKTSRTGFDSNERCIKYA